MFRICLAPLTRYLHAKVLGGLLFSLLAGIPLIRVRVYSVGVFPSGPRLTLVLFGGCSCFLCNANNWSGDLFNSGTEPTS